MCIANKIQVLLCIYFLKISLSIDSFILACNLVCAWQNVEGEEVVVSGGYWLLDFVDLKSK